MTCACCIWTTSRASGTEAMCRVSRSPTPKPSATSAPLAVLWAFGLGAALLPGQCVPQEPPHSAANQRLEALRNALMDKALKAPTRVRSASWVDESGTLHENLRIDSDIRLRGIRVLSYLEESGALKADVVEGAAASLIVAGACPQPARRFKRHAALVQTHAPTDGRLGYHFMPELALRAEKSLQALFARDGAWVVTPTVPVSTAYERVLLGPDTPTTTPYVMHLGLEASKPAVRDEPLTLAAALRSLSLAAPRLPAISLLLTLRMEESGSGHVLWREQAALEYPQEVSMVRQPLPAAITQAIDETLLGWHLALDKALECEPLQFAVTATESGELTIKAGSRSGMRIGDQLLLLDRTRIPGNLLEAGALDGAALLEVQFTAAYQSRAKRVAGPAPLAPASRLVALPL